MRVKLTRRATSRTERRADGSEIVERSEEETYEEQEGRHRSIVGIRAPLVGSGFSAVRRLLRRGLGAVGIALLASLAKDLISWLVQHVS